MPTYYIYLIPYLRAGKTVYYCGYTNNPERRAREHSGEREWCGELRVIDVQKEDGTWWWSTSQIMLSALPTRKLAMEAERMTKKLKSWTKHLHYTNAGWPVWRLKECGAST
jgi:predicted GIY-YIG superfamily endonuclease